jgi:hypothetical protein
MMERFGENIAVFGPLPGFIADNAKPCDCEDKQATAMREALTGSAGMAEIRQPVGIVTTGQPGKLGPDGVVRREQPPAQPGDESPPEGDRRFHAAFERAVLRHVGPDRTPSGKPNPMLLVFPWNNYGGFATEGFMLRQSEIGKLDPGTYFVTELRQFVVPHPNLRLVG